MELLIWVSTQYPYTVCMLTYFSGMLYCLDEGGCLPKVYAQCSPISQVFFNVQICLDEGVCPPKVYAHLCYIPNNIIYKMVKRLNIVTEEPYAFYLKWKET